MKIRIKQICALFLVCSLVSGCTSYPKEVKKALERSYGLTFPGYTFRGNPVGNFGVGTIYSKKLSTTTPELKNVEAMPSSYLLAHPDSWYATGITDEEKAQLNKSIFPEGSMGSVIVKEKISNELKLNVAVPNLAQLLEGGASLDYKKGVKVTIKASDATNRQLNLSELREAITKNKVKSYVKDSLNRSDVIVGAQDIILSGYSATIEIDKKANPELHAKLNEAVGKTLGKESELSINIKQTSEGTFEVDAINPVVAAVLYLSPPATKGLKPVEAFDDWEVVTIKSNTLLPVEAILAK